MNHHFYHYFFFIIYTIANGTIISDLDVGSVTVFVEVILGIDREADSEEIQKVGIEWGFPTKPWFVQYSFMVIHDLDDNSK